jgi:pimeloyl-ACP methyl ester carboxylesterase
MTEAAAVPVLEGVEHRFVDLPSLRMHVAEAGHGEPVLLLHGFPQHWWEWRQVIPGLAERYRVICPDLRGAGWTDAPRNGYTRDRLLADVVELLDALELDRVHLVTHDWASLVGYQLCLRQPERVSAHLALSIPPPYFAFDLRLLVALFRHAWFNLVNPLPVLAPFLFSHGNQRLLRHLLLGFATNRAAFTDEDVELFLGRFRDRARARAGSALYRHFIQPEAARILSGAYRRSRLVTPTHVVVGADDPNVRPEFVRGFEQFVKDLTVEYVDGASHFIVDDRPDVVLDRALALFKGPVASE